MGDPISFNLYKIDKLKKLIGVLFTQNNTIFDLLLHEITEIDTNINGFIINNDIIKEAINDIKKYYKEKFKDKINFKKLNNKKKKETFNRGFKQIIFDTQQIMAYADIPNRIEQDKAKYLRNELLFYFQYLIPLLQLIHNNIRNNDFIENFRDQNMDKLAMLQSFQSWINDDSGILREIILDPDYLKLENQIETLFTLLHLYDD